MKKQAFLLSVLAVASGCASVNVDPVRQDAAFSSVCIQRNSEVRVEDLDAIIAEAFERHAIDAKVYSFAPSSCKTVVKYTGTRRWDVVFFLSDARIDVYQNRTLIGSAERKGWRGMLGGGGLNPAKWASTRSKIYPLVDELVEEISIIEQ